MKKVYLVFNGSVEDPAFLIETSLTEENLQKKITTLYKQINKCSEYALEKSLKKANFNVIDIAGEVYF